MPKYLYKQKMSNQLNIRLSDDDYEWYKTHGMSEYIRKLIADDREKEERRAKVKRDKQWATLKIFFIFTDPLVVKNSGLQYSIVMS